mmetsp:Transcript_46454/g.69148  ORF Transcript_46454/g.69148 Transcript_46454/m.69148 type:complete len:85 (+) Transcript_46454:455-709(+)
MIKPNPVPNHHHVHTLNQPLAVELAELVEGLVGAEGELVEERQASQQPDGAADDAVQDDQQELLVDAEQEQAALALVRPAQEPT